MRILRPGDDVHIAAVIPAFNVGGHIADVLGEMPEQIRTVIVVDDGSTDDTAAVVERCAAVDRRIHFLRHDRNR
ncbi:MAG TPA: glycosyltransferase, partial [Thermoanaerobaculia bacterium]